MFRSLVLASLLSVAAGQLEVFVVAPSCKDIFVKEGVQVGTVCAEIVGENLEVTKTILEDVPCCMTECHLCNLPGIIFNPFMVEGFCALEFNFGVNIETLFDFVCSTVTDEFWVAGHMSIECMIDLPATSTRRLTGDGAKNRQLQRDDANMETIDVPEIGGVISGMPMSTLNMIMPDDPYKFNGYFEIGLGCVDSPF